MLILLIPEINNRKFSFHHVIAFPKKIGTPRLQLQGASPLAAPDLSHPRHLGTLKPTLLHSPPQNKCRLDIANNIENIFYNNNMTKIQIFSNMKHTTY